SGIDSDIVSGTITLSDGAGGHTATHTLTAAEITAIAAGTSTLTLAASAFTGGNGFAALNHADNLITVSPPVPDDAGTPAAHSNTSFTLATTSDAGTALALSAPTPTGGTPPTRRSSELSGIDSDIVSGTITLSDGAGGHTATHTLTAAEITAIAAGTSTLTLAASAFTGGNPFAALNHVHNLVTVSASVTDDAGNTAAPSNTSFTLDTTADAGTALALSAANPTRGNPTPRPVASPPVT